MCDTKRCNVCNEVKCITEFYTYTRSKTQKTNYDSKCKKCHNIRRRKNTVVRIISDTKRCNVCNEVKCRTEFYFKNKEKTKITSRCKKCHNIRRNERIKGNTVLRIIGHQKTRIRRICKEKGLKKTITFDKIFGIDQDGFRIHMESLFYGGITWENYSNKMWEVDHIIELRNIQTFEDLIRLCHYTNTQPLLIEDHKNKSKSVLSNMCDTKRCNVCKEDKSKDDFYTYTDSKTQKIKYESRCKKCSNKRRRGEKRKFDTVLRIV
jgi:hypothetical protein